MNLDDDVRIYISDLNRRWILIPTNKTDVLFIEKNVFFSLDMVSTHLSARAMSVSLVHFTECQVLDSDAPGSASLFPLCATPDGTLTLFWLYSARSYKLYNDSKKKS